MEKVNEKWVEIFGAGKKIIARAEGIKHVIKCLSSTEKNNLTFRQEFFLAIRTLLFLLRFSNIPFLGCLVFFSILLR